MLGGAGRCWEVMGACYDDWRRTCMSAMVGGSDPEMKLAPRWRALSDVSCPISAASVPAVVAVGEIGCLRWWWGEIDSFEFNL